MRRSYWAANQAERQNGPRDPNPDLKCDAAREAMEVTGSGLEFEAGRVSGDSMEERPVLASADVAGIVIVWVFVEEHEVSDGECGWLCNVLSMLSFFLHCQSFLW